MSKAEMIKKLEYLVVLQSNFLKEGNWADSDMIEDSIKRLEKEILEESDDSAPSVD